MVPVVAPTSLSKWLAGLDEAALTRLLAERRDALTAPTPRTLAELSERLGRPESLASALRELPLPCVQLVEAAVALGAMPPQAELSDFLAGDEPDHGRHVERWLRSLTERAIVWPLGDGRIVGVEALAQLFPAPLGLGPPLPALVATLSVESMRGILSTLGVAKVRTSRFEVIGQLLGVLSDADTVRGIADTAPNAVRQELFSWAREVSGADFDLGVDFDDDDDDDDDDVPTWAYNPAAHQRRSAAAKWALERGLVFGHTWSYGWQMPAEVSRALRGPQYRAPFAAVPPPVAVVVVGAAQLAAHSGAAVSAFADQVLAVVDRLARVPIPALKAGGVGARELAKLSRAIGCTDVDARLILGLCAAVGLVDNPDGRWALTDDAERWRSLAPAERIGALIQAWWELPHTPSEARDADGKVVPALSARPCRGCLLARHNVLDVLAELPAGGGAERSALAERAMWRRPFVHVLAQDVGEPFASILAEARALGLVADGAISEIGRALIAGDSDTMRTLLVGVLPASNDKALFGADLTVVVAGAPTAGVSMLLDAAADRESRGGATVWRFTPGSIRRALDEGHSAATLEQSLAAIATAELPQPLRYLIGDIGRQHGNLQVSAAVSVIRGEDEALLKQVSADRALRSLGLRPIAPTVLGADADSGVVLTALRKAGYLPVLEGAAAETVDPERALSPQAAVAAWLSANPPTPPADPHELAARLLTRRPADNNGFEFPAS